MLDAVLNFFERRAAAAADREIARLVAEGTDPETAARIVRQATAAAADAIGGAGAATPLLSAALFPLAAAAAAVAASAL